MKKNKFQNKWMLLNILGLFFILLLNPSAEIYGQEETSQDQVVIDQSEETTNEEVFETTEESVMEEVIDASLFKEVIPYARYLNYQYVGDGSKFTSKDIIMEFMPDANGIFQVAEFTDTEAVAYVYQIRPEGLYELAYFENYTVVEDLRYSPDAQDETVSLVLPVDLSEGNIFKSGYQEEIKKKVIGTVDTVTIGQDIYNQVLIIEEMEKNDGDTIRSYYANEAGLVLIERIHPDGSTSPIIYLNSKQGSIMDQ
ncbi:hypothetical protein [Facklamia miroungae]|uniref:Uncharacterized protein n=1 Tax=Facklamia miroungae TaxID=120956 RepID=A0A1G7QV46_9LACT|nr:hypothetical protein [Facklamia miroungae]NKZ29076.1 hypothetical protein [Facklamia miroungae]SDG02343.1 hypothetical protein SAMN05421791_102230 [Facklamia miroungae]